MHIYKITSEKNNSEDPNPENLNKSIKLYSSFQNFVPFMR